MSDFLYELLKKLKAPMVVCETFVLNVFPPTGDSEDVEAANPIGFDMVGMSEDEFYDGDTEIDPDEIQDDPPL